MLRGTQTNLFSDAILELIGNTPLLKVKIDEREVFLKLEMFNPGKSIKDRPALFMIEAAEKEGLLNSGHVVEATSGNTGIGLALVCAAKGYRCTIFMPENASLERRKIMTLLGANVVLTPSEEGMSGALKRALEFSAKEGAFYTDQFKNKNNPISHYRTTSVEILEQLGSLPKAFVCAVGTGGTISGIGRRLKEANPECKIYAVEPKESPILSKGEYKKHKIEGIAPNFVPPLFDRELVDEIIKVSYEEALHFSKRLAREFGILCGISSGANVCAALKVKGEGPIVTVLPDTAERYLSLL